MANYLIIGCSSGIGAAISKRLIQNGETVYGLSRRTPDHNGLAEHKVADVLSNEFPDISNWPAMDGLVYAPGSINLKPFNRLTEQDFNNDFKVNVLGAVQSLQKALPLLKQAELASVLLFSTVAVQRGMPFHASVAAAKGAVEGLTRSLAAEWAPKIRVNAIAPSLTETPLASMLLNTDAKKQSSADRHPLKRIGTDHDIASAAIWLLSKESSWVTGQVIHVDGGLSAI